MITKYVDSVGAIACVLSKLVRLDRGIARKKAKWRRNELPFVFLLRKIKTVSVTDALTEKEAVDSVLSIEL